MSVAATPVSSDYHVADITLADWGHKEIRIAETEMPGLMAIRKEYAGKKPLKGNKVSHAKNRTRRRFEPNLHTHRFWIESEKRFVKLRVSTKGMRIIDKKGIEQVLAGLRANGEKI